MQAIELLPRASHRRLPPAFARAALAALLLLLFIMVISQTLPDEARRAQFSDLNSPVIDILASAALFLAAWKTALHSRRLAVAWGILGLAALLYAIGDASWAVLEVFLQRSPFPSIADAFYLLYYPVFLAGVVLLIRRPSSAVEVVNDTLDLAVILAAAILVVRRERTTIILMASGAVLGPVCEALPVAQGAWSYATPQVLGMPIWLPLAYALFAALTSFASWSVAATHTGKMRPLEHRSGEYSDQ